MFLQARPEKDHSPSVFDDQPSLSIVSEVFPDELAALHLLDAGCGSGILLGMLSQLGHECYGVDYYDCSEEHPNIFSMEKINFTLCLMLFTLILLEVLEDHP